MPAPPASPAEAGRHQHSKSRHKFNYKLLREHAGGKQMKGMWTAGFELGGRFGPLPWLNSAPDNWGNRSRGCIQGRPVVCHASVKLYKRKCRLKRRKGNGPTMAEHKVLLIANEGIFVGLSPSRICCFISASVNWSTTQSLRPPKPEVSYRRSVFS